MRSKATTTNDAVLQHLWDMRWHNGMELTEPHIGGNRANSRIHELVDMGWEIESRPNNMGSPFYDHRLKSRTQGPKPKRTQTRLSLDIQDIRQYATEGTVSPRMHEKLLETWARVAPKSVDPTDLSWIDEL